MPSTRSLRFCDRKTIYSYVQRGLIPQRIESNVRSSKHQGGSRSSFEPRLVKGKGANKRIRAIPHMGSRRE